MSYCALFAGQSVQESGMGRELWRHSKAREALRRLESSLGSDLEHLMTEMGDPELALTYNAQRAIHASHVAHWTAFQASHPGMVLGGAAGHSMGIAAALVAAGSLSLEDSGRFILERARAFSDVCKGFAEPMGLAAVSADYFEDVSERAKELPGVSVALHNTVGRGVLGGTMRALEDFSRRADAEGWPFKIKILKVEGPYHTPAFSPAKERMAKALSSVKILPPRVPVFMGTSGREERDPGRIRELLAAQADSPELYFQAVWAAYDGGLRRFVEVSFKPQPVTWIPEQLIDEDGKPLAGVSAAAVKTADIDAPLPE